MSEAVEEALTKERNLRDELNLASVYSRPSIHELHATTERFSFTRCHTNYSTPIRSSSASYSGTFELRYIVDDRVNLNNTVHYSATTYATSNVSDISFHRYNQHGERPYHVCNLTKNAGMVSMCLK